MKEIYKIMRLKYHYFCALATIAFHLINVALAEDIETGGPLNNNDYKKPNIVIIMADDVGTGDVPFFWPSLDSSKVLMPNLQKLADKGVLFEDAHSSPKCAPSRYMLLSGNYPHRGTLQYGVWNVDADTNQFTANQKSIAETLQGAGYHTGMFGKWHLGGKVPPNGIKTVDKSLTYLITADGHDWSLPLIEGPGDIGFDESYVTLGGIQSPPYSFFRNDMLDTNPNDAKYWAGGPHQTSRGTSVIPKKKPGEGDPSWDCSAYDMVLVNETSKFIDTHLASGSEKPFFAYVALGAVHDPQSPADKYLDGSPILNVYETRHLDMLGAMDKAVGSVVSMIEDKGLSEETIIIFTSDNGGLNKRSAKTGHLVSGPLRGAKASIWEGGHRVPLIIRYDNKFPPGKRRKRMVGLNDIYATICELVGVDVPQGSAQDSVSFASYIKSSKNKTGLRTYLGSWQLNRRWQHAIRRRNLKVVHYPHNNTFMAFNLKRDISETINIIDKPWVAKKIQAMYEKLMEIGPCPENDRSDSFRVSGLGEDQNCEWFRQDTNRCALHFEGELSCPSICRRFFEKCSKKKMYGNSFNI
jgi:arylsulfatase A-like enzyme